MTTRPTDTPDSPSFIRLPEPPEPADMNNHLYLNAPGNAMHLAEHFGNPDTTLIMAGVYISPVPTSDNTGLFEPDLLIAFNADPDAAVARRGYVIAEQGKPPDFVLEIGSRTTGLRDTREKRAGYAALGIPEYWRFDNTGGQYHDAPLAGDRLVDGAYQPIPISTIGGETYQGRSDVLYLDLRWEHGQLGWIDPNTGLHIIRFADERTRADSAEARARDLEEQLRRLQNP